MVSPKRPPPDRFSASCAAIAAGIEVRKLHVIREAGAGPEPVEYVARRGGALLYDTAGIAQWALCGAFVRAGIDLLSSARLAKSLSAEFGYRASSVANIDRWARSVPGALAERSKASSEVDELFWVHRAIRNAVPKFYVPFAASMGDVVLDIVDREYVLAGPPVGVNLATASPDGTAREWAALAKISWKRVSPKGDGGVSIDDPFASIDLDFECNPQGRDRAKAVEDAFQAARNNAVAIVRINVSLAIRNALDLLHNSREALDVLEGGDHA
jgi:hypothetical protein